MNHRNAADLVAIILAAGISVSLVIMVCAALYGTVVSHQGPLGENATQVLLGWGGGMIGVLGAYVGYRFGAKARDDNTAELKLKGSAT